MKKTHAESAVATNFDSMLESRLQQCLETVETHLQELKLLLDTSESTRLLVSTHFGHIPPSKIYSSDMWQLFKILDYRNDSTILENGFSLRRLAVTASSEGKLMLQIAEHTRKDSRTMRVASLIALIYLPASLVAVRCSIPSLLNLVRRLMS